MMYRLVFFFNDTATTEIYTLSLHDALPISSGASSRARTSSSRPRRRSPSAVGGGRMPCTSPHRRSTRSCSPRASRRSEEHTSELQSRQYLVCRLLLEKKNQNPIQTSCHTRT